MGTYDYYDWFRVMVYGRNANQDTGEGATSQYPTSVARDDTGEMFTLATPAEVTKETFRKIQLVLGQKLKIDGTTITL